MLSPAPAQLATRRAQVVVAVVFVASNFMSALDSTIVNVALPALARQFRVGTSQIDWLVIGYMLSLALWIPASGWIGDRLGTKRTILIALAAFTVASAFCGLSTSLGELVLFRVLQGVGGGMLIPVGVTMLMRAFPPAQRAKAARILVIPTVIGPASGPILGGFLVDRFSWHWIFFVNVPVGLAVLIFGLLFLDEQREPNAGRFDVQGFVLAGVGLALVLFSFNEGPTDGWTSGTVLISGLVGLAALALMVHVELRKPEPMLKLDLLTERLFRACNLVSLFGFGSFVALLFVMSLFLQQARGESALSTGLITFLEAIGVAVSSQIVGRVYLRLGPRRLMAGGTAAMALVMVVMGLSNLSTSLWALRLLMFLAGCCMANMFIPLQTATYARISSADTGRASAIFSAQRQAAAAIGVAVVATVLTSLLAGSGGLLSAPPTAQLAAFQKVFFVDAALSLVATFISLTVRDADASNTMRGASTAGIRREDALNRQAEDAGQAEGQRQARVVLAGLDGIDRLARYAQRIPPGAPATSPARHAAP